MLNLCCEHGQLDYGERISDYLKRLVMYAPANLVDAERDYQAKNMQPHMSKHAEQDVYSELALLIDTSTFFRQSELETTSSRKFETPS